MVAAIGAIGGGILGGLGASKGADAMASAIKSGIRHQQNQFDATQYEFAPYLNAGTSALDSELALLGLGGSSQAASGADPAALVSYLASVGDGKSGKKMAKWLKANPNATPDQQLAALQGLADPQELGQLNAFMAANPYRPAGTGSPQDAQQASIDALKASPAFTSLYNTGNDTILQDAAATGGLRGGNAQNSLAQFGSSLLAQVIQQQLQNLGGISGQGAQLTSNLGQLGQQNANAQQSGYNSLGNANAISATAPYASLQGIISQLTGGGLASLGNFFGGSGGTTSNLGSPDALSNVLRNAPGYSGVLMN